jgi:uncharacterized protein (TIGR04141 family)
MTVETISVYLLKPGLSGVRDALRADIEGDLTAYPVASGNTVGTLFVVEGDEHEPDWVRLLGAAVVRPLSYPSRSVQAVLVLQAAGRWFGVTFGHGRHLLDRSRYERDFGLRVALNAVDPERLRAVQARTFNDYALHTDRQLSRLADIGALELDVQRDLLTSLAGLLADPDVGKRIDGRDAARLTAELDAAALAPKCEELLDLSSSTTYRAAFPFFDTIAEIRDPDEIAAVEQRAFEALGVHRRFSEFDLYPPELVPDEVVEFTRWPGIRSTIIIEPDSRLLREPISAPMAADTARAAVERYRLVGLDSNGRHVGRWTYLECLHYETQHAGKTYVLDGGRWYGIEQSLVTDVDRFVQTLGPSGLALPTAQRKQIERDYNATAAQRNDLALVDRKLVYLKGRSGVEPCDLFSDRGHLVHVKPRKGGSAPLSHLFAQAVVSAECLVGEPMFRVEFRKILKNNGVAFAALLDDPIRAADFPIVLALITDVAGDGYGLAPQREWYVRSVSPRAASRSRPSAARRSWPASAWGCGDIRIRAGRPHYAAGDEQVVVEQRTATQLANSANPGSWARIQRAGMSKRSKTATERADQELELSKPGWRTCPRHGYE